MSSERTRAETAAATRALTVPLPFMYDVVPVLVVPSPQLTVAVYGPLGSGSVNAAPNVIDCPSEPDGRICACNGSAYISICDVMMHGLNYRTDPSTCIVSGLFACGG